MTGSLALDANIKAGSSGKIRCVGFTEERIEDRPDECEEIGDGRYRLMWRGHFSFVIESGNQKVPGKRSGVADEPAHGSKAVAKPVVIAINQMAFSEVNAIHHGAVDQRLDRLVSMTSIDADLANCSEIRFNQVSGEFFGHRYPCAIASQSPI